MAVHSRTATGRPRFRCHYCHRSTTGSDSHAHSDAAPGWDQAAIDANNERIAALAKKRDAVLIVTSAQNNTEKDYRTWATLKQMAKHRDAELVVLPVHYKNISHYGLGEKYQRWWAAGLEDHLIDRNIYVGGGVELMGAVPLPNTAINPLSGMQPIAGRRWTIYGHPQVSREPVAAPAGRHPKLMFTTGSAVQKNYSETKTGYKAQFHHTAGALIVEISGNTAFVRQVLADHQGHICDLEWTYTPEGWSRHDGVLVLVTGDEHVKWMRPGVKRATYTAADSIVNTLRPQYIVRHDVFDAYAISHHHRKNFAVQYRKWHKGWGDARAELDQVLDHLEETTPEGATNLIVASNHHDHLEKWLGRTSANEDMQNARLILELKAAMIEAIENGDDNPDPFRLYVEPRAKVPVEFLDRNRPWLMKGVDYSQHGDVGINGSRGNARSLANTTYKMVVGHGHQARIALGVYQVGKSTARLEYERGLSSHSNTHCVQYPNGKRTLIDIQGARWRMTRRS